MVEDWQDTVEVDGIAALVHEDEDVAVATLTLRCNGNQFSATILSAGDEWALNMRQEGALHLPMDEVFFPSRGEAVFAALLAAVEVGAEIP